MQREINRVETAVTADNGGGPNTKRPPARSCKRELRSLTSHPAKQNQSLHRQQTPPTRCCPRVHQNPGRNVTMMTGPRYPVAGTPHAVLTAATFTNCRCSPRTIPARISMRFPMTFIAARNDWFELPELAHRRHRGQPSFRKGRWHWAKEKRVRFVVKRCRSRIAYLRRANPRSSRKTPGALDVV